jgi:site-specific recombinase XerD
MIEHIARYTRIRDPAISVGDPGQRLDRHGAVRMVRRVARRAGITRPVGPHTLSLPFNLRVPALP